MKKERMKGFLSGILVSILCFTLIGTAAATIGKRTLEVDYSDIKIQLDGQLINPTDANGASVEPFSLNGTTYLPVRAVGNAMGLKVAWDNKTSTVLLTSPKDFSAMHLQMLQCLNIFKEISDHISRGEALISSLSAGVNLSIGLTAGSELQSSMVAHLSTVRTEHLPTYKSSIDALSARIDALYPNASTQYISDALTDAKGYITQLNNAYQYLDKAYRDGISYVSTFSQSGFDGQLSNSQSVSTILNLADDFASEKYYSIYENLYGMISSVKSTLSLSTASGLVPIT